MSNPDLQNNTVFEVAYTQETERTIAYDKCRSAFTSRRKPVGFSPWQDKKTRPTPILIPL